MRYRPDLLFHQQYPTWYGSKVTRCPMPTDTVPTVMRLAPEPRGEGVSASIRRRRGWMDGMVNRRELLVNVVIQDKPKVLTGLSQKRALERAQGFIPTLSWTPNATGGQRAPHPFLSPLRNVVSPYRSFRKKGREVVRPTQGGAGRGVGKSERRPVVGRIRVATSPGAQAS